MIRLVKSFQEKEKTEKKMIQLNLNKDEFINITEKIPTPTKKKFAGDELKEKYQSKRSVPKNKFVPSSPKTINTWFPKKPIGVSVRTMI